MNKSQFAFYSSKEKYKKFRKNKNLNIPKNLKKVTTDINWNFFDTKFQEDQERKRQEWEALE